ncbi:MAG: hypothetical protein GDA53_01730 [Rhodobacteraceae bacterium]|nr:hypothetical protein [Paracoccaceae bacterium]
MTRPETEFEEARGVYPERSGPGHRVADALCAMHSSVRRLLRTHIFEGWLIFCILASRRIFFAGWILKTMPVPTSVAGFMTSVDKIRFLMNAARMPCTDAMYGSSALILVSLHLFKADTGWKSARACVLMSGLTGGAYG